MYQNVTNPEIVMRSLNERERELRNHEFAPREVKNECEQPSKRTSNALKRTFLALFAWL